MDGRGLVFCEEWGGGCLGNLLWVVWCLLFDMLNLFYDFCFFIDFGDSILWGEEGRGIVGILCGGVEDRGIDLKGVERLLFFVLILLLIVFFLSIGGKFLCFRVWSDEGDVFWKESVYESVDWGERVGDDVDVGRGICFGDGWVLCLWLLGVLIEWELEDGEWVGMWLLGGVFGCVGLLVGVMDVYVVFVWVSVWC